VTEDDTHDVYGRSVAISSSVVIASSSFMTSAKISTTLAQKNLREVLT